MNATLEQTLLHDLEAEREIKELRSKYCWYAVRSDSVAVSKLFTEDCRFESPPATAGGPRRWIEGGRPAIKTMMDGTAGHVVPLVTNHLIVVDGDTAKGSCTMESAASPVPGMTSILCYYLDKFRKVNGEWLFSERRLFFYRPYFEKPGEGDFGPDYKPI
jgi:hypothetical protein